MERGVSRLATLLPGQVVPGQATAALPGEEVLSIAHHKQQFLFIIIHRYFHQSHTTLLIKHILYPQPFKTYDSQHYNSFIALKAVEYVMMEKG